MALINPNQVDGLANNSLLVNGEFQVWQRGTSFTSSGGYLPDMWEIPGTTNDASRQSFTPGQTAVPGEPKYYLRMEFDGNSAGGLSQKIEDVRTGADGYVTFSFWAKSPDGVTLSGNTLRQYFGSAGSSSVDIVLPTISVTSIWQKFELTAYLPSISGKTISGGDDYLLVMLRKDMEAYNLYLTNAKLEIGAVATPFVKTPYGTTLVDCQRHYLLLNSSNHAYTRFGVGYASTASLGYVTTFLPVTMRAIPAVTYSGSFAVAMGTTICAATSVVGSVITKNSVTGTVYTTGMTPGYAIQLFGANDTTANIVVDATL